MRTRASDPTARVSGLRSPHRGGGKEARDGTLVSRPARGHLTAAPLPARPAYPGIGPLVCTVIGTAEPGVLRRLLHAIMGLNFEDSPGAPTR
jgi:hypothetical protein